MAINLSGMFTNLAAASQPVQRGAIPADPNQRNVMQQYGVTDPLLQQFGKGLGGLLGTEMRSPAAMQQEQLKQQQTQARQLYSSALAADPQKQIEIAKQLVNIQGYEQAGLQLFQQAQKELVSQQSLQRDQQFRETLAERARKAGLEGIAESVVTAPSSEIPEIAKQIREFEKTQVLAKGGRAARRTLARQAGFSDAQIEDIIDAPEAEFKALIEGNEAEAKPYLNTEDKAVIIKTNKYGRVWDEQAGSFKNPSEMGLRPAPQVQEVINRADQLTTDLSKAGINKFTDLTDKAKTAVDTLSLNNRSLQILDAGVFTGTGAELLTGTAKLAAALGMENAATATAERTEEYVATRARQVGNFVKNFGSGTSITDSDRDYAEKAVAGQVTMTEAAIRRLLEIERRVAQDLIKEHNRIYDILAKEGVSTSSLSIFSLPPVQEYEPRGVNPPLSPKAQQYLGL